MLYKISLRRYFHLEPNGNMYLTESGIMPKVKSAKAAGNY